MFHAHTILQFYWLHLKSIHTKEHEQYMDAWPGFEQQADVKEWCHKALLLIEAGVSLQCCSVSNFDDIFDFLSTWREFGDLQWKMDICIEKIDISSIPKSKDMFDRKLEVHRFWTQTLLLSRSLFHAHTGCVRAMFHAHTQNVPCPYKVFCVVYLIHQYYLVFFFNKFDARM